jgi:hypothetical protein
MVFSRQLRRNPKWRPDNLGQRLVNAQTLSGE